MSLQRLLLDLKDKEIILSPYGGKGFEINAANPHRPINCKIATVASDYFTLDNGAIIPIRLIVFINRPADVGY